ncbi:lysylphosphatidylglycerol synthase transmembrane domain-containing protein [Halorubrum sp. AD140]|uniref:lysylphosphatidylglycerol synthase transmembrane domain-containing protein n=1 Tax=Halorubrum sp. AD140 TaxID=3050073 RepID=UPI002ACCEF95|nr:lysylphosphatidylglycerol synthase transmembrane domain-containing protein [Halorubrum sp. AD140]MDZ5812329.1 lysylphosphatidylglycerol synthase transmembrane domain-containing protein [Halorubrum sp. AD140]
MDGTRRRGLVIGGVAAIGILAALFVVVGADRVVDTLRAADPALVAATFGLALCWLVAWSLMLRTVLGSLEVDLSVSTSFLVYAGAVFANNVTPFGQAGGEPVAAALIAKVSGSRYETGLVGIASVDVLNVVPSISLVFLGVGAYAATAAVGERLGVAVGVAVALIASIVTAIGLGWRYRRTLVERIPPAVGGILGRLRRFDAAAVEETLAARLRRFFDDIERVGTSPRRLAAAVGLSLAGWTFQAAALTAAFAAVGHEVSPVVPLFVVPLAYVAGATPLPGGLGGIEAAFVALLVPTTGVAASAVTAAVLVFRGAVYWMPVLIGGLSVSALGIDAVR